jgi:hypothetical protein
MADTIARISLKAMRLKLRFCGWIVIPLAVLVWLTAAEQPGIHRDSFEGRQTAWLKALANVEHRELAHDLSTQTAHSGRQSEHIQLQAGKGTFIHYYYPVGKIVLLDEMTLSVWIKANRPGMQLLARLVLPRERDPQNLDRPLTTLLRGDTYELVGRWQRLDLRQVRQRLREAQMMLRAELQREVNFEDAYVDQVVLNVYGGPGLNEVWIDDLEIGPVLGENFRPAQPDAQTTRDPPALPVSRVRVPGQVEVRQDRLVVNGKPLLLRMIRDSGTPLSVLREAGFNAVLMPAAMAESRCREAADLGFWLVPTWSVLEGSAKLQLPGGLVRELERFPVSESVLAWHLGGGWSAENTDLLKEMARAIAARSNRPLALEAWDGLRLYSRHVGLLGTYRWPLYTGLELADYHHWLAQRRRFADPGSYLFTWIQTHTPGWFKQFTPANNPSPSPQPEHIRLLSYLALAAGYRGLAFWTDESFADPQQARGRLLQLALLNLELEIVEPFLATAREPVWLPTRQPDVMAAVFRCDAAVLVLLVWTGKGGQFVAGNAATGTVEAVIPGAPEDAQVWEVTAGQVRALKTERVGGGVKITVPDFSLATMLVFTSDLRQIETLQSAVIRYRHLAAQWAYDLGVEQLTRVEQVHVRLQQFQQQHPGRDSDAALDATTRVWLDQARRHLERSRAALLRGSQLDYREAWTEAHAALAQLRYVQRKVWEQAIRLLDHPVCLPYAVSFETLPDFWQAVATIRAHRVGPNVFSEGNFESPPEEPFRGWTVQQDTLDAVELVAERSTDQPQQGRTCLLLQVRPKDAQQPPQALERTYLAVTSRPVAVTPGSWVRISAWIRIPEPIRGSVDGMLFFDSAAGEPLAVRLTAATPWRKITFFRQAPPTGTIAVSLALTGLGKVYVDDVRIEPLLPASQPSGHP